MEMDLKKFKEDYDGYTFQQKLETVSAMLEALLGKWESFDNIYNFIKNYPEQVVQSELDEVFAILLLGMYENQQDKLKEAEWKLDSVMNRMKQLKQQEQKERDWDNADDFLDSAFDNL